MNNDIHTRANSRAEYKRDHAHNLRLAGRDIDIPTCVNPRRRKKAMDAEYFCRTYFPEIFFNPFTSDQKEIISAIMIRIKTGGHQAIAAERGGGKTQIIRVIGGVYALVYGLVKWFVLIGINSSEARRGLADIKRHYEKSELLAEDFPEICYPVRDLSGAHQRAGGQTHNGDRTDASWNNNEITLPTVKGSLASGSMITPIGIDGSIRGLSWQGIRPDLVLCDDLDTRESAHSVIQTQAKIETLDRDIAGLKGTNCGMPVVLLGTIITNSCVICRYTDRKMNPAWNGIRHRRLKKKPIDESLWDKYIDLRRECLLAGDNTARAANKFYLKNRKAMDFGAIVSNIHRFSDMELEDKSKLESSALQACYNDIADMGWESFGAEYQGEPPESGDVVASALTATTVQKRCSGLPRGVVPAWCEHLTAAIDLGARYISWAVVAWREGMIGHVVDYGQDPVHSPLSGDLTSDDNRVAVEQALLGSLMVWRDWEQANGWTWEGRNSSDKKHVDKVVIDCGYLDTVVYSFLKTQGGSIYVGGKGYGSTQKRTFRMPSKAGRERHVGHNWWASWLQKHRIWLHHMDADFWKKQIHSSFLTPTDKPGSMTIWGEDPYVHKGFGKQIVSEMYVEEFVPGKGWKKYFRIDNKANHFLDAMYMSMVGASMLGGTIIKDIPIIDRSVDLSKRKRPARRKDSAFLDGMPELRVG